MRNIMIIASATLASCLLSVPASAAGLLGGALSGGSSGGGGTGVSVPHVASVSVDSGNSGTNANGTLLDGGGSTLNVGLHDILGDDSNVGVTLPGTGNAGRDGTIGGVAGTANGLTGNGGTIDALLSGVTDGGDGGIGGGGAAGPGAGAGGGTIYGSYGFGAAGAACQQDTRGIVRLLNARYSNQQAYQWGRAAGVRVVKVPMCPQIKATVGRAAAANANISTMRGIAAADPLISTSLGRARIDASHVLGVGQSNGNLTVFVY